MEEGGEGGILGAKGATVCLGLSEDEGAPEAMVSCDNDCLPYSSI